MPERQHVYDMVMAGFSGAATSILHKIKTGQPITSKSIIVDTALAMCALILAYIICEAMHFTQETSRAVYFGSGWLGSRIIGAVEKNADKNIARALDKITERIKL